MSILIHFYSKKSKVQLVQMLEDGIGTCPTLNAKNTVMRFPCILTLYTELRTKNDFIDQLIKNNCIYAIISVFINLPVSMSRSTLTIATRQSPLALKQTESVKEMLLSLSPNKSIDLLPLTTTGDTFLETRLNKIGGKGLFTKELEAAMLNNKADIAVHSMKDMPNELPEGLTIAAILKREDPRDAFISDKYNTFDALPKGAIIGTSSLRRECQIKALRPDIIVKPLRGNINTRLKKVSEFDGIILAAAGLKRMGLTSNITDIFDTTQLLPAAGQGALGIEALISKVDIINQVAQLICQQTKACVIAERAVIQRLNGGCQVPIAAHCNFLQDGQLHLRALVGNPDGTTLIQTEAHAPLSDAQSLGEDVARILLEKGAQPLLDAYVS